MNKPHVRWLIRRDMAQVMSIENASFSDPWREDDFIAALRERNVIGMVAEDGEDIAGYMIYRLNPHSIEVINFAVSPQHLRKGVGTAMVEKLRQKLAPQRRRKLTFNVKDDNLGMHLFLRAMGFRATAVDRQYFDNGQDAYHFVYRLPQAEGEPVVLPFRRDTITEGDAA